MRYADFDNPVVQEKAHLLAENTSSTAEIVSNLFHYVRDGIQFAFHPEIDQLSASEIINRSAGQCNNKSIVFLALCRALDIPARIHFSDIDRNIHRGFIPVIALPFFPDKISHSWLEIEIDGRWHRIDSYINDLDLFYAGRAEIIKRGWDTGFSVADPENAVAEFSLDKENFVQMAAVTKEHGSYTDPADYFESNLYQNRKTGIRKILGGLVMREMNRRVKHIRQAYQQHVATTGYNRKISATN